MTMLNGIVTGKMIKALINFKMINSDIDKDLFLAPFKQIMIRRR